MEAASVAQMRIFFALKIRVSFFLVFIYKALKVDTVKQMFFSLFPIYIRKPHAFFPLLAATGAPRRDQLRIFFVLKIRVSIFLVFIYTFVFFLGKTNVFFHFFVVLSSFSFWKRFSKHFLFEGLLVSFFSLKAF